MKIRTDRTKSDKVLYTMYNLFTTRAGNKRNLYFINKNLNDRHCPKIYSKSSACPIVTILRPYCER